MVNLQVMSTSGSEREKKDAIKVLRLLERGRHWVLVCLLLSNVVVNESLRASFFLSLSLSESLLIPPFAAIFLDSVLGGGVGAVVVSTCLSTCSNRTHSLLPT